MICIIVLPSLSIFCLPSDSHLCQSVGHQRRLNVKFVDHLITLHFFSFSQLELPPLSTGASYFHPIPLPTSSSFILPFISNCPIYPWSNITHGDSFPAVIILSSSLRNHSFLSVLSKRI